MVRPVGEATDRCGSCGNDLRVTARFCDACGAPVAPAAPNERKQVTVLFADVVGSMTLAAALDAERLQQVMNELFNRASAVVQRYQGTVDKFTGDGLMALFGAPVALEDHALRACISALEIQAVTKDLGAEVLRHDGVALQLRIGLNSGDVIVGEIGSGPGRYTAVGHPVGMAQRMEAAAQPRGVLCSLATARLVQDAARFGPIEDVAIKGANEPVPARRLVAVESDRRVLGRNEGLMLGRDDELKLLQDVLDAEGGRLVGIVGAPGVGKSRLISEFAAIAAARDIDVVTARCEAHTTTIAFRALSRMLRALFAVDGLSDVQARVRTAAQYHGHLEPNSADAQILFEAMGIADTNGASLQVSVDGRRRKLAELMRQAVLARRSRTVFLLDDAHWIDAPSDAVLADFVSTLEATMSMFVITYRPEFNGSLHHVSDQTITLRPLVDVMAMRLAGQLLGHDSSLAGLAERIALAAVGNPFFVEEIVRDLAGRGVLSGSRGDYRLVGHAHKIAVPATVQAVLAARIDRLPPESKSILNAAAVIGTHFDVDTLNVLLPETVSAQFAELISAEMVDQTEFVPRQRYCFRHPLVRTVAYESQLSTTRALAHRRLAAAIEKRDPGAANESAALIATHLAAAGEPDQAYRWHLRAAEWLRSRDLPAAREEWLRARRLADQLPDDHDDVIAMRVAPRTMLISTALYVGDDVDADEQYRELQDLTTQVGDLTSLALATAGRIMSFTLNDIRIPEGAALASELEAMVPAVECDPATKSIILISVAFARFTNCEFDAALSVIEAILALPQEEPTMELAVSNMIRSYIEICRGDHTLGRSHFRDGLGLARELHPANYAIILTYLSTLVALGMFHPNELIDEMRDALRRAESFGDICGIIAAECAYGTVLLRADNGSCEEAVAVLELARANIQKHSVFTIVQATTGADLAVHAARNGRLDDAIDELRALASLHINQGFRLFAGRPVEALIEVLVDRGTIDDLSEAHRLVDQSQSWRPDVPAMDLWCLRSRALLAKAEGNTAGSTELATDYLALCEKLDARGRLAEARRMVDESLEQSDQR
jgi:adenylate cyclase